MKNKQTLCNSKNKKEQGEVEYEFHKVAKFRQYTVEEGFCLRPLKIDYAKNAFYLWKQAQEMFKKLRIQRPLKWYYNIYESISLNMGIKYLQPGW